MLPESGICRGTVRHRRFGPRPHEFSYRVFLAFLEVERIPELMQVSRWSSHDRWNVAAFCERDHFGDPRRPLRERIAQDAARAGVPLPDGPVFVLTQLRHWGYCFNPVSFFYCYDTSGRLAAVLAEVNNTFGDSENYWLWAANERPARGGVRRYHCGKRLHVSPFMGMDMDYTLSFSEPDARRLLVHVDAAQGEDARFDATLRLACEPWSRAALHRALARHPWMTGAVSAAIHWQALRLWWKGTPVHANPGHGYRPQREITRRSTAEVSRPA